MMEHIVPALTSALSSASLLAPEVTLLAAVSGGADSTALLLGLHALRAQVPFRLLTLHVEHGLRGAASLEDAAFVSELCDTLQVQVLVYHAHLSGGMETPGTEERARQARRQFYRQAMAESGAQALLLAHHQDDQAETLLMHLLRGAGAGGLGSMRPCQPFEAGLLLRPFLSLPRATLLEALQRKGQPWREDESNQLPCTLRNQLRLAVMPLLRGAQPKAVSHMAQAAQRMQWDEECLGSMAQQLLHTAQVAFPGSHALEALPLREAPQAVALRALRLWFEAGLSLAQQRPLSPQGDSIPSPLSYQDTLALYALVQGEEASGCNLPEGLQCLRTGKHLHLLPQGGAALYPTPALEAVTLSPGQKAYQLGPFRFQLLALSPDMPMADGLQGVCFPLSLLQQGLLLRCPQPGDTIQPFGAPGRKPLRRYFTDRKTPAPFRSHWPLLCQDNQVLWVVGVGAAEGTRVSSHQRHSPLFLLKAMDVFPTS